MRIWVKPDRLAQLKLTPTDLIRAVNEQNAQFAAGKIGQTPTGQGRRTSSTRSPHKGRLPDAKEFGQIIVRANPDGSTRAAEATSRASSSGSKDYEFIGRVNGKPATLVGIFLQPGANALEVAQERAHDDGRARDALSGGPHLRGPYDTTRFVEVSIREVVITLGEAMLLVILVVFLFLQSWRATLIPLAGGAGVAARRVRRALRARLLDQHADAVRHGAGDRHRRRRRDRRARERRADHARGAARTPREAAIKAMHEVTGPDHRDRADADAPCSCRSHSSAGSPASCTASSRSRSRSRS